MSYLDTQPVIKAWIEDTRSWNSFADSLGRYAEKNDTLSPKQFAAAERAAVKHAAKADAPVDADEPIAISADALQPILTAFACASASGLKKPKMRFDGFSLTLAPATGKNAGDIYVKRGDEWVGRIAKTGQYIKPYGVSAETNSIMDAKIAEVADNPMEAAVAYGRLTGNCSCCGRALTDPESVRRAIGPICAKRFGFMEAPINVAKIDAIEEANDGSYHEIWTDETGVVVKKFTPDGYGPSSVLAGQTLIQFVDSFESIEEAQAKYPDANLGNQYISEHNTFDHLPDGPDQ